MKYIASTYDSQSGTISESARAAGQKIITFNGILKYEAFPLAQVVKDILELGTRAMSTPVEIEFAVNLNRQSPKLPNSAFCKSALSPKGTKKVMSQSRMTKKAGTSSIPRW